MKLSLCRWQWILPYKIQNKIQNKIQKSKRARADLQSLCYAVAGVWIRWQLCVVDSCPFGALKHTLQRLLCGVT